MSKAKVMSQQEKCPYWAISSRNDCGMTKGGMYIPMPEHVSLFCRSGNFTQCRQYIRGCEITKAQDKRKMIELYNGRDRRKLQRIPEELYLDLVVCDRNVGPQVMNAYKAKSLDVSLGGLRIESFKELTTDTIVSFVLDPDFSSDSLLGVGEVKWCEPIKDSNKYESGIAFSNYSSSESMKEYLGM
jgi:hypothetical protein